MINNNFDNKRYVEKDKKSIFLSSFNKNSFSDSDNFSNDDENYKNEISIGFTNYEANKQGPNINLKIGEKKYKNKEEKEQFYEKIKKKKKTELCKNYELYHDCYYKDECSFAHGIKELKENMEQFSNYKIKSCKNFDENSYCNFGQRCSYQHKFLNKRLFTYQFILRKRSTEIYKELRRIENENGYCPLMDILKKVIANEKINIPRLEVFKSVTKYS